MRRGDIVTVSAAGDYGKPRPAVVIQSDGLKFTGSILVALMTSAVADAPLYRLTIEPNGKNGLKVLSQIMIDKIMAIPRDKCGSVVGRLDQAAITTLNARLTVVIGLAD